MDQVKMRALQSVRRFNFERCNRYQSVAEHSFHVALLALDLSTRLGWDPHGRAEATLAALMHDACEAATGDLPYLVKSRLPIKSVVELEYQAAQELDIVGLVDYPVDVLRLVDFCDALELCMYLQEEARSGNYSLRQILKETMSRVARHELYQAQGPWVRGLLGVSDEIMHEMCLVPQHGGLKH